MDKRKIINDFNSLREVCLSNAEDLLVASKSCLDTKIDHASFHLSLLALEEIGKVEMELIKSMSELHPKRENSSYNLESDDHERKIFWAFWGPSFGKDIQSKQLIDNNQNIAKVLHEKRLIYLYTDRSNPRKWTDIMDKDEARNIYDLVTVRLKLARNTVGLNEGHIGNTDENLQWFLDISNDKEKIKEFFGLDSQRKLMELNDVKEWIQWLRDGESKKEDEIKKILENELNRTGPSENEILDPKWKIKVELVSPSHSIKQKNLEPFNKISKWICIYRKDAHTLNVDFILSKNVPIQLLWQHGWGIARMFASALNIATNGFFWWNVKIDTSKYYEEIWDIQNNLGVKVEFNPKLEVNWNEKRLVLRPVDINYASLLFTYILDCWQNRKDKHLDRYVAGLTMLAKNDIHLRLEMNTFEQFFLCLKDAMIENKDWDEKISLEEAYYKANNWWFSSQTNEMKKTFILGFEILKSHNVIVDLANVYAIKLYSEVYIQTLAQRYFKEKGQEIRLVLAKDNNK